MSPPFDPASDSRFLPYRHAASYLQTQMSQSGCQRCFPPVIGVICGSGLSGLSSRMTSTTTFPYSDIPGFPASTVQGHKNEVVFGLLHDIPAICFRGRFHSYEGYSMDAVALPVRVMRCLGVKVVFVTNAAGGLHPEYNVGDVVVVQNHLALPMLAGLNPLKGRNDEELGVRFPPTSNAYDETLAGLALDCAKELGLYEKGVVRSNGTYCFVSGPMYESRAECRFLKSVGGDAVGMSTIPEIVAAHHAGMKVLCLSVISNKVIITGDEGPPANHEEVLLAINQASQHIQSLMEKIIQRASKEYIPNLPALSPVTLHVDVSSSSSSKDDEKIRVRPGEGLKTTTIPVGFMAGLLVGMLGWMIVQRSRR